MKDSWHTYLLIAVAVVVTGVSALIATGALSFTERFVLNSSTPNNELPPTDVPLADVARRFVESTQQWETPVIGSPPKPVPLFVSVPIVEADGRQIQMGDPNEAPLRPPVSNAWLLEHNLDFLNAGVLAQDPDGDGFSNLAEWEDKTNPTDPESHPPYSDKLSFLSRQQQEYIIRFSARPDSERFQIQKLPSRAHPDRDNFYLRMGETSDDGKFRVEGFEEKRARNNVGIEADASVVKVTYLPDGKTYEVVRNENTIIPTYFAEFDFALDNEGSFYVKEGDAFNILKDPETKYRLEKVNEDSAVINYQTGAELEQTVEIKKK